MYGSDDSYDRYDYSNLHNHPYFASETVPSSYTLDLATGHLSCPCPMMNTLANHGFIPHNGGNITKQNAIKGLADGLNFDAALASLMWDQAIIANPEPNATFFTL